MKSFSTSWKGSTSPRKQRKYRAQAPLHLRKQFLSATLSKDLRKSKGMRSVPLRKGDTVKVMRGKYKGKEGKIVSVFTRLSKIAIEGLQLKKHDGSKVDIKLQPSNVKILTLDTSDKKRFKETHKKEPTNKTVKKEQQKTNAS